MLLLLKRLLRGIKRTGVGRRFEESFNGDAVRLDDMVVGGAVDFAGR